MAITQQLNQKQAQVIALTPQLRQAIKLLEFSNIELETYLAEVMLENPLLSMEEQREDFLSLNEDNYEKDNGLTDLEAPEYDNLWTNDEVSPLEDGIILKNRISSEAFYSAGLEQLPASCLSLREHLLSQVNSNIYNSIDRLIAYNLIDNLDERGYLLHPLEIIAAQLHCDVSRIEATLILVQKFEPVGVFARSPTECISLQLEDRGELDHQTKKFLEHIDLFVDGKYEQLMKVCQLNHEKLNSFIHKIRQCDPRPGLQYEYIPPQAIIPDVIAYWDTTHNQWRVRLNEATLPKLYVDQTTYQRAANHKGIKKYLQENLGAAQWLMKALEQRSSTIYKVASAIVEYQQDFLSHGIRHLKPLTLKAIADTVEMHESTISRTTQNKYIATPRGMFELKYFFTASIASMYTDESHSNESVKHILIELIAKEDQSSPYSDDQLVHEFAQKGIDIARRTIAKYREELNISSSYLRKKKYLHRLS